MKTYIFELNWNNVNLFTKSITCRFVEPNYFQTNTFINKAVKLAKEINSKKSPLSGNKVKLTDYSEKQYKEYYSFFETQILKAASYYGTPVNNNLTLRVTHNGSELYTYDIYPFKNFSLKRCLSKEMEDILVDFLDYVYSFELYKIENSKKRELDDMVLINELKLTEDISKSHLRLQYLPNEIREGFLHKIKVGKKLNTNMQASSDRDLFYRVTKKAVKDIEKYGKIIDNEGDPSELSEDVSE